jgi:urea transporter
MLQDNPLTGLLFLIGIWWAALAVGAPAVGVGALLGLLASTMTAIWTHADASGLRSGLYGFNGVLVGVAIPTFLRPEPLVWLYVVLGADRARRRPRLAPGAMLGRAKSFSPSAATKLLTPDLPTPDLPTPDPDP